MTGLILAYVSVQTFPAINGSWGSTLAACYTFGSLISRSSPLHDSCHLHSSQTLHIFPSAVLCGPLVLWACCSISIHWLVSQIPFCRGQRCTWHHFNSLKSIEAHGTTQSFLSKNVFPVLLSTACIPLGHVRREISHWESISQVQKKRNINGAFPESFPTGQREKSPLESWGFWGICFQAVGYPEAVWEEVKWVKLKHHRWPALPQMQPFSLK